uniref:Dynein heavy chain linker domain-containing protein n=1 Tax=Panagrolaimus davidi TaxID=227884 RepID=A0A914P8A3_9BILA
MALQVENVLGDWNKSEPSHNTQKPKEALQSLKYFEDKMSKLIKSKTALEISDATDKLNVAMEELKYLKGVWSALSPFYDRVDELKEKTWLSIQPREISQTLDELLANLKLLPAQYLSYDSYENARKMLQNYSRMNLLIVELKSEALKERHWKQLMKELRVNWNISDLQLGQVWDADLLRHENGIRQILLVAHGEMALEEFLKQVREYWQNFEVELVNYQNKIRLIRGWDDLFNKLNDHMNSLAAMKLSPY